MYIFKRPILLLMFLFCQPVYGNAKQIEDVITKVAPNLSVGIFLQDAESGKILAERRSDELFPPASTTKLFTAAAGLLALSPDYTFKTFLKSMDNGDIYIQFGGDPSLTADDLILLIKQLKQKGIDKLTGNIIIDDRCFQAPYYARGWGWDALSWYYAPPITGIILNQNKIKVVLDANRPIGQKALVALDKEEPIKISMSSDVSVVTEEEAASQCQISMEMDLQNNLKVGGCWPKKETPSTLKVALKNPTLVAEQVIRDVLSSEHMYFRGKILKGVVPKHAQIIASHESKPLKELLKPLLEDSNNLFAESILKTLGVEQYQIGSFQMGLLALKAVLSTPTGIDFSTLSLFDGSGLSYTNLIKPKQFGQLLYAMYHDKINGPDFMQSLPISGETGNLKNRMTSKAKCALKQDIWLTPRH